jgi:hypothetical protein
MEKERRFLDACSNKMPLPRVARIFRKLDQEKEKSLARSNALVLTG